MIVKQIIMVVLAVVMNMTVASILPTLLYFILTKPGFAAWLRSGIEDGDGIPHKQDIKDMVILFFASMMSWFLLNVLWFWLYFDKELLTLSGAVFTIVGVLFGISKFNNNSK